MNAHSVSFVEKEIDFPLFNLAEIINLVINIAENNEEDVKGDADFVFYELLKVIEESDNLDSAKLNGALKNVKGLYYKDINFHENNEVVFTGEADW